MFDFVKFLKNDFQKKNHICTPIKNAITMTDTTNIRINDLCSNISRVEFQFKYIHQMFQKSSLIVKHPVLDSYIDIEKTLLLYMLRRVTLDYVNLKIQSLYLILKTRNNHITYSPESLKNHYGKLHLHVLSHDIKNVISYRILIMISFIKTLKHVCIKKLSESHRKGLKKTIHSMFMNMDVVSFWNIPNTIFDILFKSSGRMFHDCLSYCVIQPSLNNEITDNEWEQTQHKLRVTDTFNSETYTQSEQNISTYHTHVDELVKNTTFFERDVFLIGFLILQVTSFLV